MDLPPLPDRRRPRGRPGLDAIDGPYWGALADTDGYRAECRLPSSTLGYTGKWAIHPAQIEPANETFAPTRPRSPTPGA